MTISEKIKQLPDGRDVLVIGEDRWSKSLVCTTDELKQLDAENKALREALEHYAVPHRNPFACATMDGNRVCYCVDVAREALAKIDETPKGKEEE